MVEETKRKRQRKGIRVEEKAAENLKRVFPIFGLGPKPQNNRNDSQDSTGRERAKGKKRRRISLLGFTGFDEMEQNIPVDCASRMS